MSDAKAKIPVETKSVSHGGSYDVAYFAKKHGLSMPLPSTCANFSCRAFFKTGIDNLGHEMAEKLVELTRVETHVEVEVIISMLSAYAIYASHGPRGRNEAFSVLVVDSDFADATALLNAVSDEING